MVDRFNNPQAPPQPTLVPFDDLVGEFRGGSFSGVRAQLDYFKALGVGAIWLSPVLKNCQYNPFSYH
ncbi:MAG TPA: alpha-amylase family glycosyl hydrolase, partial [Candidatus Limnocylindrales bacterium]|nr:alpha-amylase family glycosyl hydrolase [Candidatus Limnocylindrales bacterium]